jgi:hypothetical protein
VIVEDLDESVSVRADFSGGEVTPRAFARAGRTYMISAVNGRWLDREGGAPRHYFSVQSGGDTYFLCLRSEDMTWRLEKVILEG